MEPHEGNGAETPMPKNESPASAIIRFAIVKCSSTKIALRILGKICFFIILNLLDPIETAAFTKSASFKDKVWLLAILAKPIHDETVNANKILKKLVSKKAATAITSKIPGNACIIVIILYKNLSKYPP